MVKKRIPGYLPPSWRGSVVVIVVVFVVVVFVVVFRWSQSIYWKVLMWKDGV
jgi:hypothetical protein